MRYLVPVVAVFGLVVLALTPVPVIWGLLLSVVCLLLIVGVTLMRWIDTLLQSMLSRKSSGRGGPAHAGAGAARRPSKSAAWRTR